MWASVWGSCPSSVVFQLRLTKTANREEKCFGLILLWVLFPSQGVFGTGSRFGKGFYQKCCTNGLSPARYKWESEWQEFQKLFMESFKDYLWSRLWFYTLYSGMSPDGDVMKKKGKRALRFVGDHLSNIFYPCCVFFPGTGLQWLSGTSMPNVDWPWLWKALLSH